MSESHLRIRTQVIGFKITFVSTLISLIIVNRSTVILDLLVIPALASICFDFLINSHTVEMKRIGFYTRKYIEPKLREANKWPDKDPLWEEFISLKSTGKRELTTIGIFLLTSIALTLAIWALFQPFRAYISIPILLILIGCFIYCGIVSTADILQYSKKE